MAPRPRFFRDFLKDQDGAIAILFGLLLTVIVLFLGLGVEVGLWYSLRRDLQGTADTAALGGAYELTTGTAASARSHAAADANRNGFPGAGGGTITVNIPPLSGAYAGNSVAVEVLLSQSQLSLFSRLALDGPVTIDARSVALSGTPGDYCVIALDNLLSGALGLGGSPIVNVNQCGLAANSSSSTAFTIAGSSVLNAQFLELVGGYSLSGSATLNLTAEPRTGMPTIGDPYVDLIMPSPGACTASNLSVKNEPSLSPGTYCDGLSFSAGADVMLDPGVYIVNRGSLRFNGGARVVGTGVTFLLTGSGSDYATVDIAGGAEIDLTAPTTGSWAGISFFQDRNAPSTGVNKFNGGSTTEFVGALYFPRQELQFTGGNEAGGGCMRLVAREVSFSGNANLDNDCVGTGVPSGGMTRPRLVE